MSMAGYTKLFSSIIASTVWRGSKDTKILWITMLAMSDRNGIVEGSIPGLADMSRLTIPEAQAALAELLGPDEFSRTKDHEGRRIEAVDGGWAILNHAKYRAKMSTDERREYLRIKKAESRERLSKQRQQTVDVSTESTHTEAEATPKAKAEAEERHLPRVPGTSTALSAAECSAQDRIDAEIAVEERRFTSLALPIRDSIQKVLDSLPRSNTRAPFSASRWLRTGLTGIGRTEGALTVLKLTNDALEHHQRSQAAPILSDNNRRAFEAGERVLERLKAEQAKQPMKELR